MKRQGHRRLAGITLLEVAIVLSITGILAGAVLAGLELKARYELRKVIITSNDNVIAIQQFKLKYGALPGDMPNAIELWGKADGDTNLTINCASPVSNVSNGKPTCNGNGNGNGVIEQSDCEYYRAWQQLAAGEFIVGNFTGVAGNMACSPNSQPEINVPLGAAEGSGFSIGSFGEISSGSDVTFFDGNYNNVVMFGNRRVNDYSINPILAPGEARDIDEKIDEGLPHTGNLRTFRLTSVHTPFCVTGADRYNVGNKTPQCSLIFMHSYLNRTNQ